MTPYYQDDYVTLYHADCLQHLDMLNQADVMVTDPPYGINNQSRKGAYKGAGSQIYNASPIAGDLTLEARDKVLTAWGARPAIVFGVWSKPRPAGTKSRLIWWKRGSFSGPTRAAFMTQDEEIYVLGKGFIATSPPQRSVIETAEPRHLEVAKIGHPTPKPVGLMETLINRCPESWTIIDPFAGSGSTLRAAKNLGRKAIGFEIEEKYCEITAQRLAQETLGIF